MFCACRVCYVACGPSAHCMYSVLFDIIHALSAQPLVLPENWLQVSKCRILPQQGRPGPHCSQACSRAASMRHTSCFSLCHSTLKTRLYVKIRTSQKRRVRLMCVCDVFTHLNTCEFFDELLQCILGLGADCSVQCATSNQVIS